VRKIKMKRKVTGLASMTAREEDIMNVLWNSPKALLAREIAEAGESLTVNTVQTILRKMLENHWIKVDTIVHSNTVLARTYVPMITQEEYLIAKVTSEYQRFGDSVLKASFVEKLLEAEEPEKQREEIEGLEKMLENFKKRLK